MARKKVSPKASEAGRALVSLRWDTPESITERRKAAVRKVADLAAKLPLTAEEEAQLREIVDRAPPLTDAQRERLALLLRPGGES